MTDLDLPEMIEIEPTETCNLRCTMCHVSYMPATKRPLLDPALLDRLSILKDRYFVIGSGFEPMMHNEFVGIARWLESIRARVEIITNATFLQGEAATALANVDLRSFTVSFDGIRPETYEAIRRRASHAATMDNIISFRELMRGRNTYFSVNSTMMRSNISEIAEMIETWDRLDFDLLRLIAMVIREPTPELIRECLWPIREQYAEMVFAAGKKVIDEKRRLTLTSPVFATKRFCAELNGFVSGSRLSSAHPGVRQVPSVRQDIQAVTHPGMRYACRSPWSFARIHASGEVLLCNMYPVGNLKDSAFEDIWFGDRAQAVRSKVLADTAVCDNCDYFRFCLSSQRIDYSAATEFLSGQLTNLVDRIDFENGVITESVIRA